MPVRRTHPEHQTRYELQGSAGLSCALTYTAAPDEPATWKILLPGPGGTEDLYSAHRFVAELTTWLTPIIGGDRAAELAHAVDIAPPPAAGWRRHDNDSDDH
jgi:hypothetical protein